MHIGLMGALPQEVELLKKDIRIYDEIEIGMRRYHRGVFGRHNVTLVQARMGKVAAASTTTTLVVHLGVDAVVFVGVAGRLDEDLDIGDVVVATDLVHHDLQSNPKEFERGEVPLLKIRKIPVDKQLMLAAQDAARDFLDNRLPRVVGNATLVEFGIQQPKVILGTIATGDEFVHEGNRERVRAHAPEAKCVEMEGAAVAQVCFEHDVPVCVIRTISDRASDRAQVTFPEFRDKLSLHYSRGIISALLDVLQ